MGPMPATDATPDGYGLGRVSDDELDRFRDWLVTAKVPTVSRRVAGDYCSRLRRVLRREDASTLTGGVQNDIDTAVRTFLQFRAWSRRAGAE
jgi:hypothetical protein